MVIRFRSEAYQALENGRARAKYMARRDACRCGWCRKKSLFRALCDECRERNNRRAREARQRKGKGQ